MVAVEYAGNKPLAHSSIPTLMPAYFLCKGVVCACVREREREEEEEEQTVHTLYAAKVVNKSVMQYCGSKLLFALLYLQ